MAGRTVVCIRGAGGGGWEYNLWKPVWEKASWRFVARDLVPTSGGLAKTTVSDYVRQVVQAVPPGERPVLVGASMGGILALLAAPQIKPSAIVLVNSVIPQGVPIKAKREQPKYPPVVRWANGPLSDTRASMPDSNEETILWAWKKWRDESGSVMNALHAGVPAPKPTCPTLCVLGENDMDIPALHGLALAKWANADVHLYKRMSHVGPLLSTRAGEVGRTVRFWCEEQNT